MLPQVNGEPPQTPRQPSLDEVIDAQLVGPAGFFINGVFSTLAGAVPFDRMCVRLCRVLGWAIGSGVRGDLGPTLKLRQRCKEAFAEGIAAAPLSPPPQRQPAPAGPGEA